jgi:hypothetical protein
LGLHGCLHCVGKHFFPLYRKLAPAVFILTQQILDVCIVPSFTNFVFYVVYK